MHLKDDRLAATANPVITPGDRGLTTEQFTGLLRAADELAPGQRVVTSRVRAARP